MLSSRPDVDARAAEALPWLVIAYHERLNFGWLVRQAKLNNLQNRVGFLLDMSEVRTSKLRVAMAELEGSRLMAEDTFCWDSMPEATRVWMRANRNTRHLTIFTRSEKWMVGERLQPQRRSG